MSDNEKIISVQGLTKKFGDFTAVDHISFDVHRAEIFGFLGPNGSGKTTTIRMILGLLDTTEGDVELLGLENGGAIHQIRTRIGYMSQRFSLYNDLTVLQNLQFYSAAYGLPQSEMPGKIEETLARAGLVGKEHVKTQDLAGGWRQRLALGVAILHQPEVIFLDEPTSGVDPVSRRAFWDLLYKLVQEGVTIFVTTHYMDEAEHCHRLAFILDGKIIAYGSPNEIKAKTFQNQILEIVPDDSKSLVSLLTDASSNGELPINSIELYGSLVHVFSDDASIRKKVERYLKKEKIPVKQLSMVEPSLEDVFIEAVKKGNQS
jgi:ABC-2 type transport system ATP-binding protein